MTYFTRRTLNTVKKSAAPVRVIVVSFVLLITAGTLLLTLPVSSAGGTFTSPLDALFTATSATCVTGLSVVDTTGYWSPFWAFVKCFSPARPLAATCRTPPRF